MKSPVERAFDRLLKLPTEQRTAVAFIFADLSQALLTAPPTPEQEQLDRLAELERLHAALPSGERARLIRERMGLPKSTYYDLRRKLAVRPVRNSGLSARTGGD